MSMEYIRENHVGRQDIPEWHITKSGQEPKIWFNRVHGSHNGALCLPRRSTEGHPSLSAYPWERTFAPSAMYIQQEIDAYLCHFAFLTHSFAQVADL